MNGSGGARESSLSSFSPPKYYFVNLEKIRKFAD